MVLPSQYVARTPRRVIETYERLMGQYKHIEALRMRNKEVAKQLWMLRLIGNTNLELYREISIEMHKILIQHARHAVEGDELLPDEEVCIIFIERAARTPRDAFLRLYPGVTVFRIDVQRDANADPYLHVNEITESIKGFKRVYIVDPMAASLGSFLTCLNAFADYEGKPAAKPNGSEQNEWVPINRVAFIGVIGCPEAFAAMPYEIPCFFAGFDQELNEYIYIMAHSDEHESIPDEILADPKITARIRKELGISDTANLRVILRALSSDERKDLMKIGDYGDNIHGPRGTEMAAA